MNREALPFFHEEVSRVLKEIGEDYELLFVNDGSKDDTLKELKALSTKDPHVIYLSFSRNFGKEAAMYAGSAMQKVITLQSWMQIFRIRRHCYRKCLKCLRQTNMTVWQREE